MSGNPKIRPQSEVVGIDKFLSLDLTQPDKIEWFNKRREYVLSRRVIGRDWEIYNSSTLQYSIQMKRKSIAIFTLST